MEPFVASEREQMQQILERLGEVHRGRDTGPKLDDCPAVIFVFQTV